MFKSGTAVVMPRMTKKNQAIEELMDS